ncbi:hypothetical protein [Streptococcus equi]|uniref:hypothetical protein n=1 Tax=Streptococcus equi TaxID=1336 RepID=UPI0039C69B70
MLLNAYITCIGQGELIDALYFEKQLKPMLFSSKQRFMNVWFSNMLIIFTNTKKLEIVRLLLK